MKSALPRIVLSGFAMLTLFLTACQKKAEAPKATVVEVVKETERSQSFLAVSRQLELGGTLYGYVDVSGDVEKLTGRIRPLLEQIAKTQPAVRPFAQHDYPALAATLGLTDIRAFGVSSVPDGTGFFRNRMFLYTGGERRGLLAGLGGKPGPFTHVRLAPADASFFAEAEVDMAAVYRVIREVVAKVAGEPAGNQLEAALKKAGESATLSVLDLIYGLKGHSSIVLRLDPAKTLTVPMPPQGVVLPAVSLLLCIDNIAPVVEASLAKTPGLKRTDVGALHIYEPAQALPIEGIQPVLVADGGSLYFATSRAFFEECRGQKPGLSGSPEFQRALEHVGNEGNGLSYVSPQLFEQLRRIQALNPRLPAETKSVLDLFLGQLPSPKQPLVSVRTNLPDGVLVRSYLDRSLKQDVAMVAFYNPVTVGLVAAMAIPAFQKVRTASQEKAVLNNLRQLAAAADQFYLENGVGAATYGDLVGPTRYIKAIQSMAGESYEQLRFAQGQPLRVRLPGNGQVIQYPLAAPRPPAVR